jgi:DNA-binding transcriptional ArsR family regulator
MIFIQMGEYIERGLDEAFFALSHRTRRRMLVHLAEARETRVTDLAQRYRLSLNTVSKHVAVLERARLVRRRVAGREHFIKVVPARLADAEQWLQHHRRFWTERLDALAALFDAKARD